MHSSPLLLVHICAAVIALLSGFLATFLRKGSGSHAAAGSIFFGSMVMMTTTAAYLAAFMKPNMLNLVVSLLTFYLVTTGWWAGKRRDLRAGRADFVALVFVAIVAIAGLTFGFEAAASLKGSKDGMPAAIYFVFGSIALLCAVTDVRMFRRGALVGTQRIARHLWRMSLALLIATVSFFPGQARQLPEWLRKSDFMYFPHILLVGSMLFWIYRVKFRKRVPTRNSRARNTTTAMTSVAGMPDVNRFWRAAPTALTLARALTILRPAPSGGRRRMQAVDHQVIPAPERGDS